MVPNVVPGTPFRIPPGIPMGLNILLTPKLIHVGSSATKFDDEIIKKPNFQKNGPKCGPRDPFKDPSRVSMSS